MGKKIFKEAQSEIKRLKKNSETESATSLMLPKLPEALSASLNRGSNESLRVMQALLDSLTEGGAEEWAQKVHAVVSRRFERMPRGGWRLMCDVFNKRFDRNVTPEELKILSTKPNGVRQRILDTENLLEGAESPNKGSNLPFPSIDGQLLNAANEAFRRIYDENINVEMRDRIRTKKVPMDKYDRNIMAHIQVILANHVKKSPPANLTEISLLLYVVQRTYEVLKCKTIIKSVWKDNINAKIKSMEDAKIVLCRHISNVSHGIPKQDAETLGKVFSKYSVKRWDLNDSKKAKEDLSHRIEIYKKKLEVHEKRKLFRKTNYMFELNRGRFYRQISEEQVLCSTANTSDVKEFWSNMWNSPDFEEIGWEETLDGAAEMGEQNVIEIPAQSEASEKEIADIISHLPNWKAAGVDGVFNFFIKESKCLHPFIIKETKRIIEDASIAPEWFFCGITYLIAKKRGDTAQDHRPITCMPNLYKIFTKAVTARLRTFCEVNNIISENQLGTVRECQGAKEQALINKIVNRSHHNNLKACWIDVKKAYDSVSHLYLTDCLRKLNVPSDIIRVVESLLEKWKTTLMYNQEALCDVKIRKGILQGDSLSPLLFVLCLEPLSRRLNARCKKVGYESPDMAFKTNHLIFIDDIKLLAEDECELKKLSDDTNKFLNQIGMEINREKSASNSEQCENLAKILGEHESYKYLGILETRNSIISEETKNDLKYAVYKRIKALCETKLNAKNLFRALNEFAISKLNYYIGLVEFKTAEFVEMDSHIRSILRSYRIHLQPANTERLYIKRDKLGRGLESIEYRAERILLSMNKKLSQRATYCNRRKAILEVERLHGTQLALIVEYIRNKYVIDAEQEVTDKLLLEVQEKNLLNKIKNKELHKKFMQALEEPQVDVKLASIWLKKGNNTPQSEGFYCYLQDRNIFFGQNKGKCNHCKAAEKSVDHLATKCGRMLHHDYLHRHNEVLKCIHLLLCNRYGIKMRKKLRAHKVDKYMENDRASIKVDTHILTDIKIQFNKPDIIVHDKVKNEIVIIEIGITSADNLKTVEMEKTRKYELLAKELGLIYKCTTRIIPYVITWDGLTTRFHGIYKKMLRIEDRTEPYSITDSKTIKNL